MTSLIGLIGTSGVYPSRMARNIRSSGQVRVSSELQQDVPHSCLLLVRGSVRCWQGLLLRMSFSFLSACWRALPIFRCRGRFFANANSVHCPNKASCKAPCTSYDQKRTVVRLVLNCSATSRCPATLCRFFLCYFRSHTFTAQT